MTFAVNSKSDGTAELLVNGNKALTFSEQGAVGGALPFSFRNKIINGNFDIWQRGTSQTASAYGSDDKWFNANGNSTKTHSQQAFTLGQTDVPNEPKFFSRTVVSSVAGASNNALKYQKIEGVRTLAGRKATVSFYAKADAPKNIAIELSQSFGTGGSPSTAVNGIGAQLVALTTSWKKYVATIDVPSISGKTVGTNGDDCLVFHFWFDAGSSYDSRTAFLGQQSGTFDIAQVQLEDGEGATEFEQRSVAVELMLCQRYCQPFYYSTLIFTNADGIGRTNEVTLLTEMRAPPTLSGITAWTINGITSNAASVTFSASRGSFKLGAAVTGVTAGMAYTMAPNQNTGILSADL